MNQLGLGPQVSNLEVVWAGMGQMVAQPQVRPGNGMPPAGGVVGGGRWVGAIEGCHTTPPAPVPSCHRAAHAAACRSPLRCRLQNEAAATHAAKLTREEAVLDFSQPAAVCHNKVRAFVPWPGTFATFTQVDGSTTSSSGESGGEAVELKIVRTRVGQPSSWRGGSEREVAATKDALLIRCGDGSVLEVSALPGK